MLVIGKNIFLGITEGIEQNKNSVLNSAQNSAGEITDTFKENLNADTAQEYINTISSIAGSFTTLAD